MTPNNWHILVFIREYVHIISNTKYILEVKYLIMHVKQYSGEKFKIVKHLDFSTSVEKTKKLSSSLKFLEKEYLVYSYLFDNTN